jgi:hypothetical protein
MKVVIEGHFVFCKLGAPRRKMLLSASLLSSISVSCAMRPAEQNYNVLHT